MKRDVVIAAAVADGKFAPERIGYYRELWNQDAALAERLIAMLQPDPSYICAGTVEHVQQIGQGRATSAGPADSDDSSYPADWLPEVKRQGPAAVIFEDAETRAQATGRS
jgi:hypothetical protein